ncbi:MAG TPA: TonB-dependent receptor [Allosphingosinicella sp.]
MRRDVAAALAAGVSIVALATPAQAQQLNFNIPAGSLKGALDAYSRQSRRPIIYKADEVKGVRSHGYRGAGSPQTALEAVLSNTGFFAQTDHSGAIAVVRMRGAVTASAETMQPPVTASGEGDEDTTEAELQEQPIIVTGTSIRGTNPNSAPLDVYTRKDFEKLGVVSVDQLLQAIPQNLNSTGSVGSNSIGRAAGANARSINAPDLRGLGPNATLSLLNGRRLPLANLGRGADLSLIPLGAVERVEVLTEGASSIYGADAVGGVINFILREDYEGALTSVHHTFRGDGGYSDTVVEQTGGFNWGSGGVLASFSLHSAEPLRGKQLNFVNAPTTTLSPIDDRWSGFLSAHQALGSRVKIFADLLYSDRDTEQTTEELPQVFIVQSKSKQAVGSLGFSARLTDELNFDVIGTYGHVESLFLSNRGRLGGELRPSSPNTFNSTEITAKFDGKLFALAGEDVRFAVGGGYLEQDLLAVRQNLERETRYAFGELNVPLVGEGRNLPLVKRLELNLSARYTSTSDYGDSFDPKVGIYWKLSDAFAARGTWSHSFRAPELLQLAPSELILGLLPVDSEFGSFPDPFSKDRSTVYLLVSDISNPNLEPETSNSFTLGVDFKPPQVPGLKASATYYNIRYKDRIAFPPDAFTIAADPELYSEFIFPADRAVIDEIAARSFLVTDYADFNDYDPDPDFIAGRATRLIINGLTNLASTKASGVDVTLDYSWAFGAVRMNTGAKFTYMIENDEKPTAALPALKRLNTVSFPVNLKGRAFVGASRGGLSGQLTVNYVNGYSNTAVDPDAPIDSWTTVDLSTSYRFADRRGPLKGLRLGLNVRNLFNTDPPFVAATESREGSINRINYDAANHNPFGRLITLNLTKEW